MKVLIKEIDSDRYLSVNGQWVTAADHAKDFLALIPAYNFAKQNTSARFQVVLYCSEDNYRQGIIEGKGEAVSGAVASSTAMKVKVSLVREKGFSVPLAPFGSPATGTPALPEYGGRFCFN
jgi:hypothetical protein